MNNNFPGNIQDDVRTYIQLSTFGLYKKGHISVKVSDFKLLHGSDDQVVSISVKKLILCIKNAFKILHFHHQFGMSLDKTLSEKVRQNAGLQMDQCFLREENLKIPTIEPVVFFIMNFKSKKYVVIK